MDYCCSNAPGNSVHVEYWDVVNVGHVCVWYLVVKIQVQIQICNVFEV